MGLDIFLYRAKKIEGLEHGIKITEEELKKRWPNARRIDPKSPSANLKTVKNLAVPVAITEKVYMANLVGNVCGIKNVASICLVSSMYNGDNREVKFDCYDELGNKLGKAVLVGDQIDKAVGDKDEEYLVLGIEEVDYQRKGLNDRGWDLLPENCEYSDNKTNVRKMVQFGGLSSSFLNNWVDGETLLLAWW